MSSANDWGLVRRHLPVALVSPGAVGGLARTIAELPLPLKQSLLSAGCGLECRLAEDANRVDLLLGVERTSTGAALSRAVPSSPPSSSQAPATQAEQVAWSAVRRFCGEWASPGGALESLVDNVWLEFDIPEPNVRAGAPSVFFACVDAATSGHAAGWRGALERGLDVLFDGEIPEPARAHVWRCLDALPDGSQVFQVGALLGRQETKIKLCVSWFAEAEPLLRVLTRIGWSGDRAAANQLASTLFRYVDRIALQLDVGDGLANGVGLECAIGRALSPSRGRPRVRRFLDALVELGWASAIKRDALLRWPGRRRLGSTEGERALLLRRVAHHVKVVLRDDGAVAAKAYIGIVAERLD